MHKIIFILFEKSNKKISDLLHKAMIKKASLFCSIIFHLWQAEVNPFAEDATVGPTVPSLKPSDYFGHGIFILKQAHL